MTIALKSYTFQGTGSGTDAPTSVASNWMSYTFARPQTRVTTKGDQAFIVKRITFTCGSKGTAQKLYARVSYADGDPYQNSHSVTAKATKQADQKTVFQGFSFPLSTAVGGPLMRVWLVGSEFYFDRNSTAAGHIVASGAKQFAGAPVGTLEYAEVSGAPLSVSITRDENNPTKVVVTWLPPDDTGGVPLTGYRLQYADDVDFSINRRQVDLTRTTWTGTGFAATSTYQFRITARNEVSDHFGLLGGDWTAPQGLGVDTSPGVPADDFGASGVTLNYLAASPATSNGPVLAYANSLGRLQDVVRSPDTGEFYVSLLIDPGASGQLNDVSKGDVTIARLSSSGAYINSMHLLDAGHGTTLALENVTGAIYVWVHYQDGGLTGAPDQLIRMPYTAGTFTRDTLPTPQAMPQFGVNIDGQFDWLNDQVVFRSDAGTNRPSYELRKISEYLNGTDRVYSRITLTSNPPVLQGFFTFEQSLFIWTGGANTPTDPPTLTQYSWRDGSVVSKFDGSGFGFDTAANAYPGNWYEPEGASLYNVDNTAPAAYVGMTLNTGSSQYGQAFRIPLLTEAQAEKNALDSSSGDPGGSDGSGGTGIVFTPVPDTSSTETVKGGLLLSSQPRGTDYAVYLTDRGGSKRIGQLTEFNSLSWDRRRSDISQASITLTSSQVLANLATLNRMATGRSELVIFRGDQRMWEGPVTSVQWRRSGVTINAQDILWWVSRTVVRNNYTFAPPNQGYSVEFIAGVLLLELGRKEALDPPVNVVPFMRTYIEDGDAKTTKTVHAGSTTGWQLLDEMSTQNGLNYTVVGRALHIWDASRAALGRTRTVTEQDFLGDPYITEYGGDLATEYTVFDGVSGSATAGAVDPFYGEIELLAQAYGEASNQILDPSTGQVIGTTLTPAELLSQAERNLAGRNPVPTILNIPDNSGIDPSRVGLGLDVLVPGVYIPVQAVLSGRTVSQVQKLNTVTVKVTSGLEAITVTMIPAASVVDPTAGDA